MKGNECVLLQTVFYDCPESAKKRPCSLLALRLVAKGKNR